MSTWRYRRTAKEVGKLHCDSDTMIIKIWNTDIASLQEPTLSFSSSTPAIARAWKKPNPNSAVLSRTVKCATLSCSSLPTSRMLTVVSLGTSLSEKGSQADQTFLTAMRPNDVAQALDLDRIAKDHVWKVEPSCATSGEGKIWQSRRIDSRQSSSTDPSSRHLRRSLLAQPERQGREEVKKRGSKTAPLFSFPLHQSPLYQSRPPAVRRKTSALAGTLPKPTETRSSHLPLPDRQNFAPANSPPHTTDSRHISKLDTSPNLAQAQQENGKTYPGAKMRGRKRTSEREIPWTTKPREVWIFDGRFPFLFAFCTFAKLLGGLFSCSLCIICLLGYLFFDSFRYNTP